MITIPKDFDDIPEMQKYFLEKNSYRLPDYISAFELQPFHDENAYVLYCERPQPGCAYVNHFYGYLLIAKKQDELHCLGENHGYTCGDCRKNTGISVQASGKYLIEITSINRPFQRKTFTSLGDTKQNYTKILNVSEIKGGKKLPIISKTCEIYDYSNNSFNQLVTLDNIVGSDRLKEAQFSFKPKPPLNDISLNPDLEGNVFNLSDDEMSLLYKLSKDMIDLVIGPDFHAPLRTKLR